jgi:MFS family permease
MRRQSSHRYQTFPTPPPKTPLGDVPPSDGESVFEGSESDESETTPLPIRQLALLAFLSLSEQTALNSISPYLPDMVASMPNIPSGQSGLYVGIVASAFALAQLSTNFLWGYASDIVGRKPVLLSGTIALGICFSIFGFCKAYWQVVVVNVAMGMLNGNAACVPTVLGEVTDRSNQSRAFIYLPIIYSLGGITGPALGGILVGKMGAQYPYLAPNLLGAAMLAASFVVVGIWFEETLDEDEASSAPTWLQRLSRMLSMRGNSGVKQGLSRSNSWAARWPRSQTSRPLLSTDESDDDEIDDHSEQNTSESPPGEIASWRDLLNKTTLILLTTYLVFQLSNISANSLYPIFAAARPPTGRGLDPETIGLSLSLAGVATIIFQAFFFEALKARLGNLGSYRLALLGIGISMALMPWVGYLEDRPALGLGTGKFWLYLELGVVLVIKNICAVGGLSSVMLLVCRPTPAPHSPANPARSPTRPLPMPVSAR